jgi:hypothetical protein
METSFFFFFEKGTQLYYETVWVKSPKAATLAHETSFGIQGAKEGRHRATT